MTYVYVVLHRTTGFIAGVYATQLSASREADRLAATEGDVYRISAEPLITK